ncbi:MAG: ribonuclease III [Propioniciclava sp.]
MISAASSRVQNLLAELGIVLDPQLLALALTHRSWAYEHGGAPHNERLEFLGDSVLGIVVTEDLYTRFPDDPEGVLARKRASVVNTYALAEVARSLGLGSDIKLGRGELSTGGSDKDSILADATEALIAAVYLSAGRTDAERFVRYLMEPLIARSTQEGVTTDWKTALQEFCAGTDLPPPEYDHTSSGPDHDKRFIATATVGVDRFTGAEARSKKLAQQLAAELALGALTRR